MANSNVAPTTQVPTLVSNLASTLVSKILKDQPRTPVKKEGCAFAPANVALCKYWGKRNHSLNLPVTSSLSISLGNYGTKTLIKPCEGSVDSICVNGVELVELGSGLSKRQAHGLMETIPGSDPTSSCRLLSPDPQQLILRLTSFLDLFRQDPSRSSRKEKTYYRVETESNIPIGAGLASSASGFAAAVLALADLYQWQLSAESLSILARLGSGSACRSLWHGFVEWNKGEEETGTDSHGKLLDNTWEDIRIGLLILNHKQKSFSSRDAMKITQDTSEFYKMWPMRVDKDMESLKSAIKTRDFELLGKTSEANALSMHALMLTARPPILFTEQNTMEAWNKVFQLRKEGVQVYFTQDAGPNLKLLFPAKDIDRVSQAFKDLLIIAPMEHSSTLRYELL